MRKFEEIAKDKRVEIEHAGPGWFVGTVKLTGEHGRRMYHVIFSVEPGRPGKEPAREHASISRVVGNRLPGWAEMEELKEIIWEDEEECYQLFPKKSQYVNLWETLHIWRDLPEEKET